MSIQLSTNEILAADHHDCGARLVVDGKFLAIHRPGDTNPALIPHMPEGIEPSHPAAVAYNSVRGTLGLRREIARIDGNKRWSDEGRAEKYPEINAAAVRAVVNVATEVEHMEHAAAQADRAFYAPAQLAREDTVGALVDRELRERVAATPTAELPALLKNRRVLEAVVRDVMPADGMRGEFINRAFREARDADEPARAESIRQHAAATQWARNTLDTTARVLAAELKGDVAQTIAQLDAHDLAKFSKVFDLPRGGNRLVVRERAA